MRRTILAADIELRPTTAAKLRTMEAIIAPVREAAIQDETWDVVETAMFAMGFRRPDLERGDSPFAFRFTFELDGMVVMFDTPETKLRMRVCEHTHTFEEFREIFCGDPLTGEHFEDGYQVVTRECGRQFVVYRTWEYPMNDYYDCGEVSE
jgi:hypothetical protein